MAIDTDSARSRRALLGAAIGGAAAVAAGALPASVVASDPNDVVLGANNTTATRTVVTRTDATGSTGENAALAGVNTAANGMGLYGKADGQFGQGVFGQAPGAGVVGLSEGTGVSGIGQAAQGVLGNSPSNTGVLGFSGGAPFPTAKAKTGVYGKAAQDSSAVGVLGESGAGVGVQGVAANVAGYAFRGSGRVRLDKVSGVATIAAGKTSVIVTPGVDVTAQSFVLLTPGTNIGSRALWFTTDATNDRVTIRMNKSRSSVTPIAWLLLS
jgi:hypothetical protein